MRLDVRFSMLKRTGCAEEVANLRKAGHVVYIPCQGRHLGDGDTWVRAGEAFGDVPLTFSDSQSISM